MRQKNGETPPLVVVRSRFHSGIDFHVRYISSLSSIRYLQEMMRARVQVQEDYLAGLERDRREWNRYQIQIAKSGAVAAQRKRRQARLAYGSDQLGGIGSDL